MIAVMDNTKPDDRVLLIDDNTKVKLPLLSNNKILYHPPKQLNLSFGYKSESTIIKKGM